MSHFHSIPYRLFVFVPCTFCLPVHIEISASSLVNTSDLFSEITAEMMLALSSSCESIEQLQKKLAKLVQHSILQNVQSWCNIAFCKMCKSWCNMAFCKMHKAGATWHSAKCTKLVQHGILQNLSTYFFIKMHGLDLISPEIVL